VYLIHKGEVARIAGALISPHDSVALIHEAAFFDWPLARSGRTKISNKGCNGYRGAISGSASSDQHDSDIIGDYMPPPHR
jgi:hypothetical protein